MVILCVFGFRYDRVSSMDNMLFCVLYLVARFRLVFK